MRTQVSHCIDIITEVTEKVFLWTRVIGERDITVGAWRKIATILTNPCPSWSTTIIEECYPRSLSSRSLEKQEELMGDEGGMEESLSEMYEGNICVQKK